MSLYCIKTIKLLLEDWEPWYPDYTAAQEFCFIMEPDGSRNIFKTAQA